MSSKRTLRDDIVLPFRAFQVDRTWYDSHWMTGEPRSIRPRFVGLIAVAGVLIAALAGLLPE